MSGGFLLSQRDLPFWTVSGSVPEPGPLGAAAVGAPCSLAPVGGIAGIFAEPVSFPTTPLLVGPRSDPVVALFSDAAATALPVPLCAITSDAGSVSAVAKTIVLKFMISSSIRDRGQFAEKLLCSE